MSIPLTDYIIICYGSNNLTLPTAVGNNNMYTFKLVNGTTTINTTNGQTIDGSTPITLTKTNLANDLISDSLNWFVI